MTNLKLRCSPRSRYAVARDPFYALTRDFDDLLNSVWGGEPQTVHALTPSIDVQEREGEYEITAEIAGVSEKDLDVSLEDHVLTIRGEKKSERDEKEGNYHLIERSFGTFERALRLPEGIDSGKIKAKFKDGILRVTVPKTVEAKETTKKIAVTAG